MRSSIHRGSGVILSVFVTIECASLALAAEKKPLSILLTNDDGYDAPGISAMWSVLVDAGHHVTMVAPASQQSGSSVRTTSGPFTLEQRGEQIWAVGGSPADAVLVGLEYLLRKEPPDLVVSGSNFGHNIGQSVNMSGTVGAAIMAIQRGVPAIAVSVGIRLEEWQDRSRGFPSTLAAFEPAAQFTEELIRQLVQTRREGTTLLPPHTVLNVNYPALPVNEIAGVKWTRVGRGWDLVGKFQEGPTPGTLELSSELQLAEEHVEQADRHFFKRGYITVSALDGDWSVESVTKLLSLEDRLSGLKIASVMPQP